MNTGRNIPIKAEIHSRHCWDLKTNKPTNIIGTKKTTFTQNKKEIEINIPAFKKSKIARDFLNVLKIIIKAKIKMNKAIKIARLSVLTLLIPINIKNKNPKNKLFDLFILTVITNLLNMIPFNIRKTERNIL